MVQTPDIYVVGNQPEFATRLVEDRADSDAEDEEELPGTTYENRLRRQYVVLDRLSSIRS